MTPPAPATARSEPRPPAPTGAPRPARRPRPLPSLPFVVLTALVVIAGVLGLLTLNVSVNQQAFTVAKLEASTRQQEASYSALQDGVDRLSSPARLAAIATVSGLVPARSVQVLPWPGDKVSPGAATSPAAPGDPAVGALRARSGGNDPFPLKAYLAEP